MKLKKVLLGLSLFIAATSFAQQEKKEVLFTIDGNPYYTEEFVRVYNKNLDLVKDDSQKDLDNYLDLFIGYKLKVNKANKLGLQEGKKYQGELKSYRTQLAKNYLTDTKVTDELIEEAYERSKKEIKASHILFMLNENAAPADTLKAYNKAMDVRKKALAGEDFGKLAAQYSEDPSAKENKGDLGYFSVFRMVYKFENGVYNTPKGEVSMPIRTRFGYHLIKVNDVRKNRGEITVAHIMILKPRKEDAAEEAKAKQTIEEIYQKLKQGEDFESLAKQFSQDKSTAPAGGKLNKFNSGELSSVTFEDRAFALKTPGEYSEPFQSEYGWHIVKLIEKHPAKPFDDVKDEFENRIKRDDRSKLIAASMNEKLRARYKVDKDAKLYAKVLKMLNDKLYEKTWEAPAESDVYDKTLFTINGEKQLSAKSFLNYIASHQTVMAPVKPLSKYADAVSEKYLDEQVAVYYDENLEREFPEFGIIMQEYRDGLLLFDLMEKEIWEKAKTDTIGLEQFYNKNIANYQWKERVDADIYSSTDEDVIKKTRKYLKKGKDATYIKEQLNTADQVNVIEKTGVFETDSDVLPKQDKYKEGISDIIKAGEYYYVVKTNKVLPAGPKTLDESKGRVVNDYQQYLESKWVDDLKAEFTVKVNEDAFKKVKKELR
ncbi:peptidylprolyl isomerase [Flavobacterium salilacus subsp. salilacus]|uniref:peptidylprolyl isomerase n=1 Tax=Flavobacterium TaxID=237 RepID=UPI001074A8FE|nr:MULTISPECIES: peptidylprolyl isomerase [Flavobacterium]KAF2519489.1 peptidylprolyl isomerase [Flavobacterium salilacus subsp. salilacus]MBE1614614.1 peptidylprolyl isomerase [Flavobacterium sp. SaA2.13]